MLTGGVTNSGGFSATGGMASGGMETVSGGVVATGGVAETGGAASSGGDAGSGGAVAGGSVSGIDDAELAMLRQVCVDEINMYRATLSLAPFEAASAEQGLCSDRGAKKDADANVPHSSAGKKNPCQVPADPPWAPAFPFFGSQNACPGYRVGGFSGGTLAAVLQGCLAQMWAEGEPPGGEDKCKADYFNGDTACFLAHGHYLNMKGDATGVSCGFYKMSDGVSYWMNQDFY